MNVPTSSSKPGTPATSQPPATNGASGGGVDGKKSYKDTLNLPKTPFAMKANLVQNEPASLKRWAGLAGGKGLYRALNDARAAKNSGRFVFHDGPPYANGSIHMGHLMNKTLKDLVARSKSMAGLACPYVPGWDCHGLPIEHKVMTELVEAGKMDKLNSLSDGDRKMAIRRECKKYAEKFVKLHITQMTRLLTLADYENPYLTMAPAYEAATLEVLASLVEEGLVYRALKPVHWSIANETALAEAELEYYDREDTSVYVDFEADDANAVYDAFGLERDQSTVGTEDNTEGSEEEDESESAHPHVRPSFMIWTTTPWTLPANVGVAVNPKNEYALVRVDGNVTVIASDLVKKVTSAAKAEEVAVLATVKGERLLGLRYRHPFVTNPPACGLGRICDPKKLWSIVAADYVTLEDGTGLVHTAPGHGEEDYHTGLREHLPIYNPVLGNGTYDATAPDWLRAVSVWDANKKVVEHLRASGHLFYDHTFTHSYPHDWRSKTPTIFRCTEQWFVAVDGKAGKPGEGAPNLRAMALDSVRADNAAGVKFVPEWGRNRMRGMLDSRPDWCISRQRAWGLPIPAFFTPDGASVMTAAMVRAVAKVFREKGSDAWFTLGAEDLLKHYNEATDSELPKSLAPFLAAAARKDLKKGGDILDVWFESGSSWNAVMRERDLGYPIDLYLEGSDQHRGWFQLSLLPALGATGVPPFKTLLTHGFMVAKDEKLSKSQGDSVDDLFQKYGADVMRWWVSSLAYDNDVKVDEEFFNVAGESYRKVRNTLRFMLSNLDDFTPTCDGKQGHCVDLKSFPPTSLDAWVLGEYDRMAAAAVAAYHQYDFKAVNALIYNFCNDTLSAVYLAAVKDRLYCDKADSPRRRRTQTALWEMTDGLCRLLAPILCHTADEAHRALWKCTPADERCVHLATFIEGFDVKADAAWADATQSMSTAGQALERAKAELGVENPLDAGITLPDPTGVLSRLDPTDLADLMGVSRVTLDRAAQSPKVIDLRTEARCERSWKRDGTVKRRSDGGMLSDRDAAALGLA